MRRCPRVRYGSRRNPRPSHAFRLENPVELYRNEPKKKNTSRLSDGRFGGGTRGHSRRTPVREFRLAKNSGSRNVSTNNSRGPSKNDITLFLFPPPPITGGLKLRTNLPINLCVCANEPNPTVRSGDTMKIELSGFCSEIILVLFFFYNEYKYLVKRQNNSIEF